MRNLILVLFLVPLSLVFIFIRSLEQKLEEQREEKDAYQKEGKLGGDNK